MKIPVVYPPGTKWVYTSAASYMLSAIVTKTTGQKLADYLRPRMLEPMGIRDFQWDVSPEGVTPGGNGLSWSTADSASSSARSTLRRSWSGGQLLSAKWVSEASKKQVTDGPYGYQWLDWLRQRVSGSGADRLVLQSLLSGSKTPCCQSSLPSKVAPNSPPRFGNTSHQRLSLQHSRCRPIQPLLASANPNFDYLGLARQAIRLRQQEFPAASSNSNRTIRPLLRLNLSSCQAVSVTRSLMIGGRTP